MSGITIDITSLKQAESEAKRYRYQLEKAQEIARLGYGEYNYKTGDFFWSDTIYQLFGLDHEQFELSIGNFYELLPPKEREEYIRQFEQAKETGTPFDHIFQLNKPDGDTGYFRERAEIDLHELENIFQNAPVASCMLEEPDHVLAYANEAFKTLFDKEIILDKPISNSLPDIHKQGFFTPLDIVCQTGKPYFGQEEKLLVTDDEGIQMELYLTFAYRPFLRKEGDVAAILIQALDVTEQVLNRQAIQETLKQREILLQEVYHRVKNNLALITSLLDLQVIDTDDNIVSSQLKQTQMRIHSIAQIHELLYQHDNLVRIPFHDYLNSLISRVADSFPEKKTLINPFELNVNQAIPCGLLVNEILHHLYKFTMITHNQGLITINIKERGDKIHMYFMLDRMYVTKEMSSEKNQSLSMNIIRTLVNQLDANIRIHEQPRFELFLSFEKNDARGSANYLLN